MRFIALVVCFALAIGRITCAPTAGDVSSLLNLEGPLPPPDLIPEAYLKSRERDESDHPDDGTGAFARDTSSLGQVTSNGMNGRSPDNLHYEGDENLKPASTSYDAITARIKQNVRGAEDTVKLSKNPSYSPHDVVHRLKEDNAVERDSERSGSSEIRETNKRETGIMENGRVASPDTGRTDVNAVPHDHENDNEMRSDESLSGDVILTGDLYSDKPIDSSDDSVDEEIADIPESTYGQRVGDTIVPAFKVFNDHEELFERDVVSSDEESVEMMERSTIGGSYGTVLERESESDKHLDGYISNGMTVRVPEDDEYENEATSEDKEMNPVDNPDVHGYNIMMDPLLSTDEEFSKDQIPEGSTPLQGESTSVGGSAEFDAIFAKAMRDVLDARKNVSTRKTESCPSCGAGGIDAGDSFDEPETFDLLQLSHDAIHAQIEAPPRDEDRVRNARHLVGNGISSLIDRIESVATAESGTARWIAAGRIVLTPLEIYLRAHFPIIGPIAFQLLVRALSLLGQMLETVGQSLLANTFRGFFNLGEIFVGLTSAVINLLSKFLGNVGTTIAWLPGTGPSDRTEYRRDSTFDGNKISISQWPHGDKYLLGEDRNPLDETIASALKWLQQSSLFDLSVHENKTLSSSGNGAELSTIFHSESDYGNDFGDNEIHRKNNYNVSTVATANDHLANGRDLKLLLVQLRDAGDLLYTFLTTKTPEIFRIFHKIVTSLHVNTRISNFYHRLVKFLKTVPLDDTIADVYEYVIESLKNNWEEIKSDPKTIDFTEKLIKLLQTLPSDSKIVNLLPTVNQHLKNIYEKSHRIVDYTKELLRRSSVSDIMKMKILAVWNKLLTFFTIETSIVEAFFIGDFGVKSFKVLRIVVDKLSKIIHYLCDSFWRMIECVVSIVRHIALNEFDVLVDKLLRIVRHLSDKFHKIVHAIATLHRIACKVFMTLVRELIDIVLTIIKTIISKIDPKAYVALEVLVEKLLEVVHFVKEVFLTIIRSIVSAVCRKVETKLRIVETFTSGNFVSKVRKAWSFLVRLFIVALRIAFIPVEFLFDCINVVGIKKSLFWESAGFKAISEFIWEISIAVKNLVLGSEQYKEEIILSTVLRAWESLFGNNQSAILNPGEDHRVDSTGVVATDYSFSDFARRVLLHSGTDQMDNQPPAANEGTSIPTGTPGWLLGSLYDDILHLLTGVDGVHLGYAESNATVSNWMANATNEMLSGDNYTSWLHDEGRIRGEEIRTSAEHHSSGTGATETEQFHKTTVVTGSSKVSEPLIVNGGKIVQQESTKITSDDMEIKKSGSRWPLSDLLSRFENLFDRKNAHGILNIKETVRENRPDDSLSKSNVHVHTTTTTTTHGGVKTTGQKDNPNVEISIKTQSTQSSHSGSHNDSETGLNSGNDAHEILHHDNYSTPSASVHTGAKVVTVAKHHDVGHIEDKKEDLVHSILTNSVNNTPGDSTVHTVLEEDKNQGTSIEPVKIIAANQHTEVSGTDGNIKKTQNMEDTVAHSETITTTQTSVAKRKSPGKIKKKKIMKIKRRKHGKHLSPTPEDESSKEPI